MSFTNANSHLPGQRMTQNLRKQVYGAILRQEAAWFGKTSTGELVNRLGLKKFNIKDIL